MTKEEFQQQAFPYMQELYASALRMTRQKENAEDLISDVYSRAWKSIKQYEPGTNLRAWLYRILTNTYINIYRKAHRTPHLVELDRPNETDEGEGGTLYDRLANPLLSENPEAMISNRFLDADLKKAIEDLPEEFRMVVLLCDVQSFAYQEAADMLNIPIGTVRSRLWRGRRLLQKALWEQAVLSGVVTDADKPSRGAVV